MTRGDMNPDVLRACGELLEIDEAEVLDLRDGADLLPALLAAIGLELRRKRAAIDDDPAQAFCQAVRIGWGADQPFTASGLIEWCRAAITTQQRAAHAACRAICRIPGGGELTAIRLGLALKRIAHESQIAPLRLELASCVRGVIRWQVRELRE